MTHRLAPAVFSLNRRAFLGCSVGSLGSLALAQLAAADAVSRADGYVSPLAAKRPHHNASARAVICLFQHGGPSQVDLFDPKPALAKQHGNRFPGEIKTHHPQKVGNLWGSPFEFQKCGHSGIELSKLLPHTARIADQITLVRSMTTDSTDHEFAVRLFHTGKPLPGRPVLGSWVLYGLGTENENLPAYVVLADPQGLPLTGAQDWSSGFLPAIYQGTAFRNRHNSVLHLKQPADISPAARHSQLRLLHDLNRAHLRQHSGNAELQARITNYELAARMQTSVPEAMDLSGETAETRALYGLDNPATASYGRRCLLARRLVERGVRYVQLFMHAQPWDTHSSHNQKLPRLCGETDQPSAALVMDLERLGLLDSTIVLWAGEFGRTPTAEGTDGRDHNPHGFSLWLAGGGFRQGYAHGQTDEFGYRAVEDIVRVPDLHATILHALGLDHKRLTYPYDGRNDGLTDPDVTKAQVIDKLLRGATRKMT